MSSKEWCGRDGGKLSIRRQFLLLKQGAKSSFGTVYFASWIILILSFSLTLNATPHLRINVLLMFLGYIHAGIEWP